LNRTEKPKFFYGYIIVSACFFLSLIMWGTYLSFAIFFEPMLAEFGWTRATTSGSYSLAMFFFGLLSIVAGRLIDRFGPRVVLMACGIFMGLGFLLMSQISAVWQLYLFYGVLVGMGMSGSSVPVIATIARWFVKRRGIMTGIVLAGEGVGIIIMPLLVSRLISIYGWRTSYIIIGIITLVVIILAAQFLKRDPSQKGLSPYGENKIKEQSSGFEARGLSLQGAIHTRQFWLFSAIGFCLWLAAEAIFVHIIIHAIGLGIPALTAANIMIIIGGLSIMGKITMGRASDRIGNWLAFVIIFILMSVALFGLIPARELQMLYLVAAIFGFAFGGFVTVMSPMAVELFGLRSLGVILGVAVFISTMGAVIGPVVAGMIFDITNSYSLAFLVCAIASVMGLILTLFLRPIHRDGLMQNM